MAHVTVQLVYDSSFELGYTYHFAIERVLEGELPALLKPEPGQLAATDGVLMVPPYAPGGGPGPLGPGGPPRRATLRLGPPVALDSLEARSPSPGSGLGEFLPPLVMTAEGQALEVLALELLPTTAA